MICSLFPWLLPIISALLGGLIGWLLRRNKIAEIENNYRIRNNEYASLQTDFNSNVNTGLLCLAVGLVGVVQSNLQLVDLSLQLLLDPEGLGLGPLLRLEGGLHAVHGARMVLPDR